MYILTYYYSWSDIEQYFTFDTEQEACRHVKNILRDGLTMSVKVTFPDKSTHTYGIRGNKIGRLS